MARSRGHLNGVTFAVLPNRIAAHNPAVEGSNPSLATQKGTPTGAFFVCQDRRW
jgi:hypothetical protein